MIQVKKRQSGFTIIELLLAMTGIAFLLLFVTYAILHMTNLYSKGIAIRQINQIGRQVSDEISRELRYGGAPKALTANNRLCVGTKSYIWNKKGTLASNPIANTTASGNVVGLVRMNDASYCDDPLKDIPDTTPEVLGNVAVLMDMYIDEPVPGSGIYEASLVLGTATYPPVLVGTNYQCDTTGGPFCAVGEFKVTTYARKK